MSYRHQSGAQKRKKSQKEKEFLASYVKRSSIVNWLSEPTSTSSRPSPSSSGNAEVISVQVGQTTSESVKNSDIATESVVDEIETENESDVDQIAEIGHPIGLPVTSHKYQLMNNVNTMRILATY